MKKGKTYKPVDRGVFRYTAGRTHKKNLDHKIAPRGGERH